MTFSPLSHRPRPFRRRMRLLVLPLAVALLAAACGGSVSSDPAAESASDAQDAAAHTDDESGATADAPSVQEAPQLPGSEPAGDPAAGREVFFANGCMVCHGDQGQGGIGPTLAQTSLRIDDVIAQVRGPRGIMPRFDVSIVSDAELSDVLAWLQTLPLPG